MDGNGHIRLITGENGMEAGEPEQVPDRPRTAWWVVALLIINTITLAVATINTHVGNTEMRRELNENAVLLKQLQELQAVKELSKIKR